MAHRLPYNVFVNKLGRAGIPSERGLRSVLLRRLILVIVRAMTPAVSPGFCLLTSIMKAHRVDMTTAQTIDNAYGMCDGQANAAPETHATLTATLVVASGSVFVPNTRTTSTKSSNTSLTSIAMTTSATATPTPTSATSTSTSSSPKSTAAVTTTSSSAPASTTTAAAAAAASKTLSTAQIGGIAGGVAAAAVLAALLALFIFLRRRRGGFSRVRDSWSPKRPHHPLEGSPRSIPTISAPQYQEPKVMSFTRALAKRMSRQSRFGGARPGTIGLAISPAGTSATSVPQQQRMTRWPGGDGGLTAANVTPAWTPPAPVVRRYSPEPDTPAVPLAMSPGRAVSSFNFFPQSPPPPQQQQQQQQRPQPTPLSPPQPTYQPTRPNLTVAIPPTVTITRPKRASTTSNGNGRDSIVTEFAEDGEDMTTSGLGSALIWRPPNTDANSATTYYVADKWGNWVLGGTGSTPPDSDEREREPAELETPISKTVAEREQQQAQAATTADVAKKEDRQRKQVGTDIAKDKTVVTESEAVKAAMRHLSSPTIPESVALRNLGSVASGTGTATKPNHNNNIDAALLPPLKPTIRLVTPESGRLPVNSRSSSLYSNFSMPQQVVPGTDNPMPMPAAAVGPPAGTVTASKRASRVGLPAATRDPAQLGMVHPALRAEQQQQYTGNNNSIDARPPTRRRSNSGNTTGFVTGRRDRSQTMMSQDSTTTIASSVGDSDVDVDDFPVPSSSSRQSSYATIQRQSSTQHPIDLSPVIESPGRSPVRYPQIPRSRSSAQMHAAVAAAKPSVAQQRPINPAIRKIQNNNGPSSDSPTLGVIGSQRPQMQMGPSSLAPTAMPSEGRISYYQPPPGRSSLNPDRNPGLVRSGSPKMAGPDELMVQKQQQRPQYQQQYQQQQQDRVLSQSSSPSRNNFQQQEAALPHPQSFQTRINNRSQLPSQSHSRYGPSSVYDVYNDPATTISSRPVSQETVIHTKTSATPVVPSYQAFQKQTPASPPQPFMPSPPSASEATAPQPQYPYRGRAPSPNYNYNNNNANIISPSSTTPSPTGSASSVLLAKRLGPEKAAAFQVPVESAQRKYWARRKSVFPPPSQATAPIVTSSQQQQPSLLPKGVVVRKVVHDPTSTPPTASRNTSEESNKENRVGGGERRRGGGGGRVDYEGEGYENETQTQYFLPATPGWKPQLTPKRRGDDLYLSVQ